MGAGNLLTAFQGDPGFRTLHNVKNPNIQKGINSLLGTWGAVRQQGQDTLGDYISKYLAGTRDAEVRTGQELSALDRFYSGANEGALQALRTRREAAVNDVADIAAAQAERGLNLSRVGSMGSGGNYFDRMRIAALAPIRVQAALDNANQERADWGYLRGMETALAGQRQGMADALLNRGLVPDELRRRMLAADTSALGPISQLDLANNFYGLQKKTTGLDRWANFLNAMDTELTSKGSAAVDAYSAFGNAGAAKGGGGGGSL